MCRTGSFSLNIIIILTDIRAEVPGNIKIFTLNKKTKNAQNQNQSGMVRTNESTVS